MNKLVKTVAFLAAGLTASTPLPAMAHLRWFVDVDSDMAQRYQDAARSFQFDSIYLLLLTGACGFIATAFVLDNLSRQQGRLGHLLGAAWHLPAHIEWRLVSLLLGIMLLMNAHYGVLVAPNMPTSGGLVFDAAMIMQLVCGLLFLTQLSFILSALSLLSLVTLVTIITPPEVMLDYVFEFAGIIIAFYLVGPSVTRLDSFLRPALASQRDTAAAVLCVALGAQLAELAIHNKLLNPGLALMFIDENAYLNFMRLMGLDGFNNMYFVFAGGIAELSLGVLLLFGVAVRFVAMAVAAIFMLTAAIFGLHELLGHIPILGVTLLVALTGNRASLIHQLRQLISRRNQGAVIA